MVGSGQLETARKIQAAPCPALRVFPGESHGRKLSPTRHAEPSNFSCKSLKTIRVATRYSTLKMGLPAARNPMPPALKISRIKSRSVAPATRNGLPATVPFFSACRSRLQPRRKKSCRSHSFRGDVSASFGFGRCFPGVRSSAPTGKAGAQRPPLAVTFPRAFAFARH